MDIEQTVSETMTELVDSGFVKNTIKAQLEKAIKEVVGDVMRSYGDFGKALEARMKEALGVDFKSIELPNYNQLVANWVREIVDTTLVAEGKKQIEANLAVFFKPLEKTEWRFSEIIEKFKQGLYEDGESGDITLHHSEGHGDSYVDFYFDAEEGCKKYNCDYTLRVNEGGVWAAKIKGSEADRMKTPCLFGFDSFIFQLFAMKAKVIDDFDDVGTGYGYDE